MSEPLLSPAEYQKNLNAIWFNKWGGEIRYPTLNNIVGLADETDSYDDISAELAIIKDDILGKNVRIAIHDALYKLQRAIEEMESKHYDPDYYYTADTQVSSNPIIFSQAVYKAGSKDDTMKFSYHQLGGDFIAESMQGSITVDRPCTILACAEHRANVTIDDDGFTHLVTAETITDGGANQRITVWSKNVQAGSHVYTITGDAAKHLTVKTIAIYGASGFTVVDNLVIPTGEVPYTPSAKNGKRRLYLLSSRFVRDGYMSIVIGNYEIANIQKMEEQRFSAFYDYQTEMTDLPTFTYIGGTSSYDSPFINLLTIDIEEVQ